MQQTSTEPTSGPAASRREPKSKTKWLLVAISLILIVAGIAAFFLLRPSDSDTSEIIIEEPVPEVTETPTPTPTPTPEPVDREETDIEVLNGTGIAREAAFLQEKLEDLGYTSIQVGNAEDQDYSSAQVTFSSTVPIQIKDEVLEMLEDTYSSIDSKTQDLDQYDIRIITGLRPGQSLPTPQPTPTPEATESATTQ